MSSKICPAFYPIKGANLLGTFDADGLLKFSSNAALVEKGGNLGNRYYGPCFAQACRQWKKGSCSVAQRIIPSSQDVSGGNENDCPIINACRWRHQEGVAACDVCVRVYRIKPAVV